MDRVRAIAHGGASGRQITGVALAFALDE